LKLVKMLKILIDERAIVLENQDEYLSRALQDIS